MSMEKINCFKCKHFFLTWEPRFPNGCRFFGFKSKYRPSLAVWQSSGKECHAFVEKKKIRDS